MNWKKILKTILFDECACGCGHTTSIGRKFIHGHQAKGNKYWQGKHHTTEHKAKMSEIMKTKDLSSFIEGGKKTRYQKGHPEIEGRIDAVKKALTGKPSPHKGKTLTDETRAKISQALKGNTYKLGYKDPPEIRAKKRAARLGDKNPAWVDGRTYTAYSRDFVERIRYEIKARDKHTCQDCHTPESQLGKPLNVHHIDTDRQNNDSANLVSLCDSCHAKRHRAINRERNRTNRL